MKTIASNNVSKKQFIQICNADLMVKPALAKVTAEITADVPEIKRLIGELGKIGSNLNQIARYFNQGGIISSEMRTEIKKSLRDIYEMKYEVMRMAGDFRGSD